MPAAAEMTARHERILAELAELGLALAADLQRRALAASDDAVAAQLAESFHKVGRSVRQTLALEAKLGRDAASAAREVAAEEERKRSERIAQRRDEVGKAVERLVWTEAEKAEFTFEDDDDAELAVEMVCGVLMEDIADEDFAETPASVLIERIRARIVGVLHEVLETSSPEPELRNSA